MLGLFFAYPLTELAWRSVWDGGFTLAHYAEILGTDLYRSLIL